MPATVHGRMQTSQILLVFPSFITLSFGLTAVPFHQELFESGHFRDSDQAKNATIYHLSSSIEDLKQLFKAEKAIVKDLKAKHGLFIHEAKFAYLRAVDFE